MTVKPGGKLVMFMILGITEKWISSESQDGGTVKSVNREND